jgi:glycosyltransferase involved in cell wall biosynthesis
MSEPKNIKLSVIVCAYNVEKLLEQCLDSILDQQVDFPMEILVGDDGSTDKTRAIIAKYHDKYPQKITPIYQPLNLGYSANFVSLLERGKGTFFAQVDADDYLIDNKKFATQISILENDVTLSACFHNYQVIYEGKEGIHPIKPPFDKDTIVDYNYLLERPLGPGNTTIVRRSCLPNKIPNWIRNSANHMDYCMQTMVALKGNIYYLNRVMSSYRKHENNITALVKRTFLSKKSLEINRELRKAFLANGHPEVKEKFNHIIGAKAYQLFYTLLSLRKIFSAFKYLFIGMYYAPDFRLKSHKDFMFVAAPEMFHKLKNRSFSAKS